MDVVFAIPWAIVATLSVAWDIYNNVFANRLWAGGNVFLVFNSVWGYLFYAHSLLIWWEIAIYMRNTRFIRIVLLSLSILYNIIWFMFLFAWFDKVLNWEGAKITTTHMFFVMVLTYNLIMTAHNVIINFGIQFKEIWKAIEEEIKEYECNISNDTLTNLECSLHFFLNGKT